MFITLSIKNFMYLYTITSLSLKSLVILSKFEINSSATRLSFAIENFHQSNYHKYCLDCIITILEKFQVKSFGNDY